MNTGPQYVSAGEAEKALDVERRTLIRWADIIYGLLRVR